MVELPGPWAAVGISVIMTEISDLTSPETAILDTSGFLLRILVRRKGPGCVLRTPAGTALG
jgi:hypothetical protein